MVGQVVSLESNAPVSGATVKMEAGFTTTVADGKLTVSAPVGDRIIVNVEATGFAEAFLVAPDAGWIQRGLRWRWDGPADRKLRCHVD